MISAQNHLLPLSGNKFFGYFLIPLLFVSCGALKKADTQEWLVDDKIVMLKSSDMSIKTGDESFKDTRRKEDLKEQIQLSSSVYFRGELYKAPPKKRHFKIAVMLPFHSKTQNSAVNKRRSSIMLEYYQGIQIALSKATGLQSSFSIYFYDTDNDTTKLKDILQKHEMKEMDLILGPTDEQQVRIAAYFARNYEIPLFSPLTTVSNLWSNNPYVFNLNPSDEMQAKVYLEYFKKNHKGEKLLIVRDGKRFDRGFGEALVAECLKQKINFNKIAYAKTIKWDNILGSQKTVVLLTSEDKTTMTYVVTALLGKAPNITLMGSDKWMDFSNVDFSYWERLNIVFLGTYKAHTINDEALYVRDTYRENYRDDPSWYTYLGYDQMLFALEALDAFGRYFPIFLEDKAISYANTNMVITKTKACFQNKYLQMFTLSESELKPIE